MSGLPNLDLSDVREAARKQNAQFAALGVNVADNKIYQREIHIAETTRKEKSVLSDKLLQAVREGEPEVHLELVSIRHDDLHVTEDPQRSRESDYYDMSKIVTGVKSAVLSHFMRELTDEGLHPEIRYVKRHMTGSEPRLYIKVPGISAPIDKP